MNIRPATISDAPAMLVVHRAAILRTATAFYPPDIIRSWSSGSDPEKWDDTISRMRDNLESRKTIGFVAELGNRIVGFGEITPAVEELRAVYVHPDYGRLGVGTALITALFDKAREIGLQQLKMDASLNAEAFYKQHGFDVVERGEHIMRSGLKMACVKMRLRL